MQSNERISSLTPMCNEIYKEILKINWATEHDSV